MTGETVRPLELIDVTICRGGRALAVGISFLLHPGKYLELQGQNGSGKTTLLRTLAQIQPPTSLQGMGEIHRQTGFTPYYFGHQSGFRQELLVLEQLQFSLQSYCAPFDTAHCMSVLDQVGLRHQARARICELSHGQVRRLMLGVMSASARMLWLIDEPFNALDSTAMQLFRRLLDQHFARGGCAVIATHRPLDDALKGIGSASSGTLVIEGKRAVMVPPVASESPVKTPVPVSAPMTEPPILQGLAALSWVIRREMALTAARPHDVVWPSVFHWMVIALFPFGLGSEPELLLRSAAGVFWISALLATLLGSARFFTADFEQGIVADMKTAHVSLRVVTIGKVIAGWLFVGLPLSLISLPLGALYGLPGNALLALMASLVLGSISLAACSCLFAALALMARQAQFIICLLAFPVFVPLIIFGTAAVTGVQTTAGGLSPLLVLAGLALLSSIGLPVLTARVLELALE